MQFCFWAKRLGFVGSPLALSKDRYHMSFPVTFVTVGALARHVAERVKCLGEQNIRIIGDPKQRINVAAVGTGAITDVIQMHELGADVTIVADNGIQTWREGT